MEVISAEEMRKLEQELFDKGITVLELMEHAGRGCARIIEEKKGTGNRIIIFCGPGNNGGDGLVCARCLKERNDVKIVMAGEARTEAAKTNFMRAKNAGISIMQIEDAKELEADIAIDALLGIGAQGPLRGKIKDAADKINSMKSFKISIDIPTGAGQKDGINPDATIALHLPKAEGGEIWLLDMGFRGFKRV